jgi:hypothetical protein
MFIAGAMGAYNDWSFYQVMMAGGIYLVWHCLDEIKDAIKEIGWKIKDEEEEYD